MRLLIALVVMAALAGCTASDESTTWHIQGVQCEEYPWGDMAGGDADKAGLEERLEAHYGFEFEQVKVGDDGKMYAAVCGGASGQHVEASVKGHDDAMLADGWAKGPMPSA